MNKPLQFLVFSLDERLCALHLSQVQRVIRAVDAAPLPGAPEIVLGMVDLQGQIVPLLNIRKRFGFPERAVGIDDQFIVARMTGRTVALAVDEVKEIVQRPADSIMAAHQIAGPLEHVEGIIQLDDGLVVLHDLKRFLSLDEEGELNAAMEAAHA
jgi:purine-binding chemotaxis protein CheW